MEKMIVSASFLTVTPDDYERECKDVEACGIDWIHCDVMDGKFVQNVTYDWTTVKKLRSWVKVPLDVHLMIAKPEEYVDNYVDAGSDIITFHLEATDKPREVIEKIKKANVKVGISICPATAVEEVFPFLDEVDMVLVMSVVPGLPRQKFIDSALDKMKALRAKKPDLLIEVDGGVNLTNAAIIKESGCNVVVAGNAIFSSADRKETIKLLKV